MRKNFLTHWRGVILSLIGIVATVWLALTGQLGLYIHPRYFAFTVIMAIIAVVCVLLACAFVPSAAEHSHDGPGSAPGEHGPGDSPRGQGWWIGASVFLVVATAVALLALPPATLTTATVAQRDMNGSISVASGGAGTGSGAEMTAVTSDDDRSLSVKDWAGLLRQGADAEALIGRTPAITGFITPDPDDPENVFYVARFVITCCAVDAQPVGVPVYLPGWQEQWETDSWVNATGTFIDNPSINSMQVTVLEPLELTPTEQPAEPYDY